MTMGKYIKILIFFFGLTLTAYGQTYSDKDTLGEKRAREILIKALTDTTQHNAINSKYIILKDETKAIKFAEQILFDIYGKKEITNEKPYKIFNIDNYWVIYGTLRKGWKGGTFLIIIDAHDCRVVQVTHGK